MNKTFLNYILVFAASFLIAFGYFFFLRTSYSAKVVLYPTSTLNPQYFLEAGLRFGDEKELNELLELLHSNDVARRVLLDLNTQGKCTFCKEDSSLSVQILKKHVTIERSLNRSATIVVEDKDSAFASYIANAFAEAAYRHMSSLVNDRLQAQADIILPIYQAKLTEVKILRDTMKVLEDLGDIKSSGMLIVKTPRYRFFEVQFEMEIKKMLELKHQVEHLQGLIKKGLPRFFVLSAATTTISPSIIKMCFYASAFALLAVLSFATLLHKEFFFDFTQKRS